MSARGNAPLLSVLIATLAHRQEQFLKLLGILLPQAESTLAPIEVLALQNNGEETLASYRQRLLNQAAGEYLCFVDDDDEVPGYYIEEIVSALATRPDVVAFTQECTGTAAPLTYFSLRYVDPPRHAVEGAYIRSFSHVQPVLSEIAKQGSFHGAGSGWTEEDLNYVGSVLPLLRERGNREVYLDKVMYRYLWNRKDSTQTGPRPHGLAIRYAGHRRPVITSPCFRWCP